MPNGEYAVCFGRVDELRVEKSDVDGGGFGSFMWVALKIYGRV